MGHHRDSEPATIESVTRGPLASVFAGCALLETPLDGEAMHIVDADEAGRRLLGSGAKLTGFPHGRDPVAEVRAAAGGTHSVRLGTIRGFSGEGPGWLALHLVSAGPTRVFALWIAAEEPAPASTNEALESLEARTRHLAHDLNNVLQVMDGNLELAFDGIGMPMRLETLAEATKRGRDLTAQLWGLSPGPPSDGTQLDLIAEVAAAAPEIHGLLPDGVSFIGPPATVGPLVNAPRRELKRAVLGLASNASSTICEGAGALRALVDEVEIDEGEADLQGDLIPSGRYAMVELVWSGTADHDPAERTVAAAPLPVGTPVTLRQLAAVTRALSGYLQGIEAWDGDARLRLLLPSVGANTTAARHLGTPAPQMRAMGTVLVVDDDAEVRALTVTALERNGCVVHVADDGDTGVACFERLHRQGVLDAVVLDLTMQRVSGAAALWEMRRIAPEIPVLVTSGYPASEVEHQLGGVKADGIVPKPAPMHQIVEAVQAALARRARPR